ncbi:Hsp20/alpha crystallin family protein [uncultured Ruminococcus sp.]|uniref:Hsp20/alpha crystallin family protein n=1 Tax=uncultured Ruminococcus sp. TaxID=165186 RepID=UPI0025EC10F1|nr:Hsp20/alpha crystallin family protein [uncultured Ruminococcus sp.]
MNGITPFEKKSFDLFNAFHDFENDFFGGLYPTSFKTDIRDEGDKYVMEAELPGFDKGDIQLDITGNKLTLSAVHSEKKVDKKDNTYICRERSYGSYSRSFDITGIDADKIEAEYKNGILSMVMPKKEPSVPETRRLEIK